MPTYELHCDECGAEFDRFLLRLIRREDKVCAECGSTRVRSGIGGGVLGKGTADSTANSSCGSSSIG